MITFKSKVLGNDLDKENTKKKIVPALPVWAENTKDIIF
jgi:hypothetical protein